MLEHRLDPARSILYLHPTGPLQKEDFARIAGIVDPHIEAKGDLAGLVLDIKAFPGWESLGAMAAHLKFVREHHKKVKKIAIVTSTPQDLTIEADPKLLRSAIINLVVNAVKFSQPESSIDIEVSRNDDGGTVIAVADSCGGLPPGKADELFRPLSTSKPGGSGIGAWQARELLREAGGDLVVLSRPGAGTTMRLLLPALAGIARPAAAEASA